MHVYVVFFSSPLYERDGTIPVVVLKRERVKSETKKKKENLKKNLRETKLSLYVCLCTALNVIFNINISLNYEIFFSNCNVSKIFNDIC